MRCIIILAGLLCMAATPPALRLVATVPLPMGIPRQAVASADGRTVFMAHDEGWSVVAVDVTDPRRPRLAGVGATGSFARSVALHQGRLAVADSRHGVRLLSPRPGPDPLQALPVTGRLDGPPRPSELATANGTLYVAGDTGVTAFPGGQRFPDLKPPLAAWGDRFGGATSDGRWRIHGGPALEGGVTAAGAGERHLVLARGTAVQVLDPQGRPQGSFEAPAAVMAVRVYGDRALLSGPVLAVADLATGRILARTDARPGAGTYGARLPAYVDAVRPRPGLVAAVDRFWGLRLFAEDTLQELGDLPTSGGDYTGLQVDGDRLYVGNNWGGVTILDLSQDPPRPLGTTRTMPPVNVGSAGFLAAGDRLWVQGNEDRTLRAVDVSDPVRPRLLATRAVPKPDKPLGDTRRFGAGYPALRGGLLFLPGLARILRAETLEPVGEDPQAGWEHDAAALSGDTLVLPGEEDLTLVDVSDPVRPRTAHRLPGDFGAYYFARGLRTRNGLAYLVNRQELRIVDVAGRQVLSTLPLQGEPVDVQIDGDRAYVAAYYGGLHVVDVRDPARPVRIETFRQPSTQELAGNPPCYQAVEVARGRVYVAEYYSGLQVLRPGRASTSSGGG